MDEPITEQAAVPQPPVSQSPTAQTPAAAAADAAGAPSAVESDPIPTVEGLPPGMTIVRVVRGPRRWPGILACVLAVLMLVATAIAVELSAKLDFTAATIGAYVAIGLSIAAVVVGLVAVFGRWGRSAGIVGVIVGVLGNPLVLNYGLNYLSGR